MTVTTFGVRGYEYQYKASLLIGLSDLRPTVKLFIEKDNSEDAQILLEEVSITRVIEMQAKNSSNAIDLGTVVSWLCHFEERSSSANLLSRMIDNPAHQTIFISPGRCQDDCEMFVKPVGDIADHRELKMNATRLKQFNQLLSSSGRAETQLQKDRIDFCNSLASSFEDLSAAKAILSHVSIWELAPANAIDQAIETCLNRLHKIPQSLTSDTCLELLEIVRKGRDEAIDILPLIQRVIFRRKGNSPVIDSKYIERSEERGLISELQEHGFILLTGQTQCGKSELAKKSALYFHDLGCSYRICNDVADVDTFFNLNSNEDKICLLEDPWGHLSAAPDSIAVYKRIGFLLANRRENHRLIITSRIEILRDIKSFVENGQSINGRRWIDITISDRNALLQFWFNFSSESRVAPKATQTIADYLRSCGKELLLQIGELHHLTRYDQDLDDCSLDDLLHVARQGAMEIAADLATKNENAAELLAVISCSGNTLVKVRFEELAFILSADETQPSILPDDVFSSGGKDDVDPFPNYAVEHAIPLMWMHQLEYLEKRGFVTIEGNELLLSHPNYFEAGKRLSTSKSSLQQSRILACVKRAISCITPLNSVQAIRQLSYFSSHLQESQLLELFNLAFVGLRSAFPTVRDQSLVFLVKNSNKLSHDHKQDLEHILDSPDAFLSHIIWHGDISYISAHSNKWLSERFYTMEESEKERIGKKFLNDQSVTPLDAWNYVLSKRNSRTYDLTNKEAIYLMHYDEVFIRKLATQLIVSKMMLDIDLSLLDLIFSDQHPSIVFTGIQSILQQWRNLANSIKPQVKQVITSAVESELISIRCNRLFTTFQKEDTSDAVLWRMYNEAEKAELWSFWAELYILFVKRIPAGLFLNTGAFGVTIDTAFKYLTLEQGLPVLYAWYERIDFKIKSGMVLDEYEMSITDVLLYFTKSDSNVRLDLFKKLVVHTDTSFLISTLKWAVANWSNLSNDEKEIIIGIAMSDRSDVRWIKATILTREAKPALEIQLRLLGDAEAFSKSPVDFLQAVDSQIIEDCLKFYFGHPQPLWWLAMQYNNVDFWQPVVNYILNHNIEPYFQMCVRELISWGLNGFSGPWQNGLDIWKQVCKGASRKLDIAERLIFDTARINCVLQDAKEMYTILADAFRVDGNIDQFAELAANNIELLQQTGNGAEDILEMLEPSFFTDVVRKLQPDDLLYLTVSQLKHGGIGREIVSSVIASIQKSGLSIRFRPTKTACKNILKDLSLLEEFKEAIDAIADQIDAIGEASMELLTKKDDHKLPNWVGIN